MAQFKLQFLNFHSSTADKSLHCLAQTISEFTQIHQPGNAHDAQDNWDYLITFEERENSAEDKWYLTHDNFCYSYDEKLSMHSNAQKELTFIMDRYIMRDNRREENPFVHNLLVGSHVLLTDKYDNQYLFTVNKIDYTFKTNNLVYQYTCADSFSHQLSKQNSTYEITNDSSEDDYIGTQEVDWWVANKIHPDCHIAYNYSPLEESLYLIEGDNGNYVANGKSYQTVIKVIKKGLERPQSSDDLAYFTPIAFSGSGTANSLLINLGEQVGLRLQTYEYYDSTSNVLSLYYWFEPTKNTNYSGLIYSPDSDIQSFSMGNTGDSLATVLNVTGGTFDDENITLLPEITTFFRSWFLSDNWDKSSFSSGMFTDKCKGTSYVINSELKTYQKIEGITTTWLESINDHMWFINEDGYYCYPLSDISLDSNYPYIRFNNEEFTNYTSFQFGSVIYKNSTLPMTLYIRNNTDETWYDVKDGAEIPQDLFDKETYLFIKIPTELSVANFTSTNIYINFYRVTDNNELEFAKIADACPWLENKLIDFKYFYDNNIINKKEYLNLLDLVQNELRKVNGRLLVYANQYYTALHAKTQLISNLTNELDTLGATFESEIISPYMYASTKSPDIEAVKTAYNAIFDLNGNEPTPVMDYCETIQSYTNKYINAEQRFLKNMYLFRNYFEDKVSFNGDLYLYTYNFTMLDKQTVYTYTFDQLKLERANTLSSSFTRGIYQYYSLKNNSYNLITPITDTKGYYKAVTTAGDFVQVEDGAIYNANTSYYASETSKEPLTYAEIFKRYLDKTDSKFIDDLENHKIYFRGKNYLPVLYNFNDNNDTTHAILWNNNTINYIYPSTNLWSWFNIFLNAENDEFDTNINGDDNVTYGTYSDLNYGFDQTESTVLSKLLIPYYYRNLPLELYCRDYKEGYSQTTKDNQLTPSAYLYDCIEYDEDNNQYILKKCYLPMTFVNSSSFENLYRKNWRFKNYSTVNNSNGIFSYSDWRKAASHNFTNTGKTRRYLDDEVVESGWRTRNFISQYKMSNFAYTTAQDSYANMLIYYNTNATTAQYDGKTIKGFNTKSLYGQLIQYLGFTLNTLCSKTEYSPADSAYGLKEKYYNNFFYQSKFWKIIDWDPTNPDDASEILNSSDNYIACVVDITNYGTSDNPKYQNFNLFKEVDRAENGFIYRIGDLSSINDIIQYYYFNSTFLYPLNNIFSSFDFTSYVPKTKWTDNYTIAKWFTDLKSILGIQAPISRYSDGIGYQYTLWSTDKTQSKTLVLYIFKEVSYIPQVLTYDSNTQTYSFYDTRVIKDENDSYFSASSTDYEPDKLNLGSTILYNIANGDKIVDFKDYSDFISGLWVKQEDDTDFERITTSSTPEDRTHYYQKNNNQYERVYTEKQLVDLDGVNDNVIYYTDHSTYQCDTTTQFDSTNTVPIMISVYRDLDATRISQKLCNIDVTASKYNYIDTENNLDVNIYYTVTSTSESLNDMTNADFWFKYHADLEHPTLMQYAAVIETALTEYWEVAYTASKSCRYYIPQYWQSTINQETNNFAKEIWTTVNGNLKLLNTFVPYIKTYPNLNKYYYKVTTSVDNLSSIIHLQKDRELQPQTMYNLSDIEDTNPVIKEIFNHLGFNPTTYHWYAYLQYTNSTYYAIDNGGQTWNDLYIRCGGSNIPLEHLSGWYEMMLWALTLTNYIESPTSMYDQTLVEHNAIWDQIYKLYPDIVLEQNYSNEDATTSTDLYNMAKLAFNDYKELETNYNISLIDINHLKGYIGQEIKIGDSIQLDAEAYYDEYDALKRSLQQLLYVTDISYSLRSDKDISVTVNTIKYQDKIIKQLVKLIR